ncbi:hypothetical protein NM208_g7586 [Fusarium decemcellulare]|uniref:Uncharacterized protein n=1 Tax=Fusarium decemcellulare TaxID=57161 RepID=A0ACC1S8L8_9HYPO|nr:hypothetical protein NM208_g7586 [Fusarium decemcellulare]
MTPKLRVDLISPQPVAPTSIPNPSSKLQLRLIPGLIRSQPDRKCRPQCTRCKERKVRCNRVMPQCSRCTAQNLDCVYPVRAKRRTTRLIDPALSTSSSSALSTILDRLQRLEAQSAASSNNPWTPSSATGNASSNSPSPAASSTANCNDSCATTPHNPRQGIDAMTVLKDAVDRVQELRLRAFGPAVITDPITIPTDLAKTWVQNYFTHMPQCNFIDLVDRRTFNLLPDIIDLPHIHIDPVILVIYYTMLYHGCSLKASNISSAVSIGYMNASYLGCLRAIPSWEREASGTITDLIAALCITRVAAEVFDYDLAWRMFKHACGFCQALNLHNMDDEANPPFPCDGKGEDEQCNDERKGFWEVIQIDLFFRLVLNTPPAITNNPWKVNLPWLDAGSEPPPHGIQSTAFLASSRVSLVIARFFAMLDDPQNTTKSDIMAKTEELCREMQQIFKEWQLHEWMENAPDNERDVWVVADVLFTGYTSIIYMFRKMAVLDSNSPRPPATDLDIPDSPIVEDAARHIIELLVRLLNLYPYVETMTCLFGAYRSYVAFAYLANTILQAEDARRYIQDIKLLERFGDQSASLARGRRDIVPLVRAMQKINDEIRKSLEKQTRSR